MPTLDLAPGARWRPSTIDHPIRARTLGIVIHWTAGSFGGDLATLDGPNVDCQFYVPKSGELYQLLDPDEEGWHGFFMANHYCIGIEHEGRGEAYTSEQFRTSAKLVAYLCRRYSIPARKVDPSGHDEQTFRGIFGHRDLSLGGIRVDGNDHTDTVPSGTGWGPYIAAVQVELAALEGQEAAALTAEEAAAKLPGGGGLRLVIGGKLYAGWEDALGPMRWVAARGLGPGGLEDPDCFITWQKGRWNGPQKVLGVIRHLIARYKL